MHRNTEAGPTVKRLYVTNICFVNTARLNETGWSHFQISTVVPLDRQIASEDHERDIFSES